MNFSCRHVLNKMPSKYLYEVLLLIVQFPVRILNLMVIEIAIIWFKSQNFK